MKTSKKLIALFLCVAMLLSAVPMVWAADADKETVVTNALKKIDGSSDRLKVSSQTKTAEISGLQRKGATCNAVLPHLSMNNMTITAGKVGLLIYTIYAYGYSDQYWFLEVYRGTDITEQNYIDGYVEAFPSGVDCSSVGIDFDTSSLSTGVYTVCSGTCDSAGNLLDDVTTLEVRVVDWAKPLTDIQFMDLNTYSPITSLTVPVGGDAWIYLNQNPSDHTDDRAYALGAQAEFVDVADYGGLICIHGMKDGTVELTVLIGALSFTLPVTVGNGDPKPQCGYGDACPGGKFTDMPDADNWAHDGIDYAVANGLFNGATETTFEPETPMTRGMMVTVLYRLSGSPAVMGENSFTDVRNNYYYTDPIIWATENGIVNGVGKGMFEPEESITREQLATILYRYATWKGLDVSATVELVSFPDASSVNDWAQDALSWAVASGIVTGSAEHGQTYLMPDGNATRAQVATMLMRFCKEIMSK